MSGDSKSNKTKELSEFEKNMIEVISKYHPYTITDVKEIYNLTNSFDKTIYCLRKAVELGTFVIDLL